MSPTRPRPRRGEQHEIQIERLAYGGNGVGRLIDPDGARGMAVFVPRSAPGDRIRVRLQKVRRRHAEASVVELLATGDARVEATCPHYGEGCGGCSWQHLDYEAQLAAKSDLVRDSLQRIGGIHEVPMLPIIAAPEPWYYRNKMEFTFHRRDGLGLHAAGDWRRVVAISDCRLESDLAMRVVGFARAFAAEHGLSSWDPVAHEGFLRQLVVRHGIGSGQTMVALVTAPGRFPSGDRFATGIAALDPAIVSVLHATRADGDGSRIESIEALHGEPEIVESVAGLSFGIGLETFFQTNTLQAERMLASVRRLCTAALENLDTPGDDAVSILDVFCGVGFFTLGVADLASIVVGVEIAEPSILAARDNARRNDIGNARFYAGDARRTLPEVLSAHGAPHVVILDPPRDGAGGKVMRRIARAAPERIIYVSCNPTTLARDLAEIAPFGYGATSVQPIDLFPQTYHVETIAAIDRQPEALP